MPVFSSQEKDSLAQKQEDKPRSNETGTGTNLFCGIAKADTLRGQPDRDVPLHPSISSSDIPCSVTIDHFNFSLPVGSVLSNTYESS